MQGSEPLAQALRRAASQVALRQGEALRRHGVTAAEWDVLDALHTSGPVAPSVLAARVQLTRGAVTKLVDRLRAKALVVRARGQGDARMQTLALTGAGAKLVPELAAANAAFETAVFGHLSLSRRAAFAAMLREIAVDRS